MGIALWPPRDPEAVADRIEHEDQEHQHIGRDQHHAPELCRRPCPPGRRGWGLRGGRYRDGGHGSGGFRLIKLSVTVSGFVTSFRGGCAAPEPGINNQGSVVWITGSPPSVGPRNDCEITPQPA